MDRGDKVTRLAPNPSRSYPAQAGYPVRRGSSVHHRRHGVL